MHCVTVLAVENCLVSSVVGILDIFTVANHLAKQSEGRIPSPVFETRLASRTGEEIPSFNGIAMKPDCRIRDIEETDIIFIPAILPPVESVIEKSGPIIEWLKSHHDRETTLVSACTGSFMLAEAGVLDGKRATTHWRAADKFRKRYPRVKLKPKHMIVDEGRVITAGGYYFFQKLSLYLIEKFASRELVTLCAKTMLIDPEQQTQSAYMIFAPQKQHGDKNVLKAQTWMDNHYAKKVSVDEIASVAGLGARNFKRRFANATGDTPILYLQRLRVEAAKKYLETSTDGVDEITYRVGYEDGPSFRKLFKKMTGLSPREYRKKFSRIQFV